jgi:putative ABC transport system permease protein
MMRPPNDPQRSDVIRRALAAVNRFVRSSFNALKNFAKIAWRNMEQRALASSLTGLSMALGVALMVLVLVIHEVVVGQLSNDAQGYNFIIGGGQGSPYEVVLTTVFHLGKPLYPFWYSHYKEFVDGKYASLADVAIPICLGDSYASDDGQQFRVVGTTPDMFDKLAYGADDRGEEKKYSFSSGRNFKQDEFFSGVIGSVAANRTGLEVGSKFQPTHGMDAEKGDKHEAFEIIGVLAPTGTANDRAIFINMEGFYLLEGHASAPTSGATAAGDAPPAPAAAHSDESDESENEDPQSAHSHENHVHEPLPEAQRKVTSVLVRCPADNPLASFLIEKVINREGDGTIQAVAPVSVVARLQASFLTPMRMILLVLTVLIVVVAGISILVSIYNSMSERSHDIAVMRALGASRTAVMGIILMESILLSLLGGLAGLVLGHAVLAAAAPFVEFYTGITVPAWRFTWQELLLVPALVAFATLVGLLPALTAYRTDVAKTLGGAR